MKKSTALLLSSYFVGKGKQSTSHRKRCQVDRCNGEKQIRNGGMKPDGVGGSLHDQGGPSYKVFMPQRMWQDEPWKLEEFNNVQNKVTSSYKVQTRELVFGGWEEKWNSKRRQGGSKEMDHTGWGRPRLSLLCVTLENTGKWWYPSYILINQSGCWTETVPCGETAEAGRPAGEYGCS